MKGFAVGALCGSLLLQQLSALPHGGWLVPLGLMMLLALRRRWVLIVGALAGFAWAHGFALWQTPPRLPGALIGADVEVKGVIASLVERRGDRARFVLDIESAAVAGTTPPLPAGFRVLLNWYEALPALSADQRWRLVVRLKPPRGLANPGGFDYEGSLYRRGIGATGYVRTAAAEPLEARSGRFRLARWRETLSRGIARTLGEAAAAGVIRALAVADRSGITPEQWETFRRTGTSHLMAISGLHIGLVAGALAWVTARVWRRLPKLCGRWPAQHAAALAALLAAVPYAALAGFTLPTQRALVMLGVGVAALLARRSLDPPQALAAALLAALARDPGAVVEPGFWLSFGAVAVILLVVADRRPAGPVRRWLRVQAGITIGLVPALVAFGFPVPVAGLLANAAAVPWYGLLVVPLTLLGTLLLPLVPAVSDPMLDLAAVLAGGSLSVLGYVAAWPFAALSLPGAPSALALALGALGLLLLLAPAGMPGRYLGPFLLLPLVFGTGPRDALGPGDFRATVLDVGQGLAVVVATRNHVLVYDAGPAYAGGFDSGSRVVAPFLGHVGHGRVDRLILSHADNDHMGGAIGLLERVPVGDILAGEREAPVPAEARLCPDGETWSWDGVGFTVRHPGRQAAKGNDASCVLRVENAAGALLLTGDIGRRVEAKLLLSDPGFARAEVVVAAHHGSRTSSSAAFVAATAARYVVYSAGFRNRYGFPAPEVAARWQASGAVAYNTAGSGALRFDFSHVDGLRAPREEREHRRRYWHDRTPP